MRWATWLCGRHTAVSAYVKYCLVYIRKIKSSWTWSFPLTQLLWGQVFVPFITERRVNYVNDLNGSKAAWPDFIPGLDKEQERSIVTGCSLIHPVRRCRWGGWLDEQTDRQTDEKPGMPSRQHPGPADTLNTTDMYSCTWNSEELMGIWEN